MVGRKEEGQLNIGRALRVLRHSRQVSGHEMARRLGVTRARMYQLEQEDGNPTLESLQNYLEAIDVPLTELALVVDEHWDVAIEKDGEILTGSLRITDGYYLLDEDGSDGGTYTSLTSMGDSLAQAGWALYLKMEGEAND